MFVLEQSLLVAALVGACALAYRLMTGGKESCGCDDKKCDERADLVQIRRKP